MLASDNLSEQVQSLREEISARIEIVREGSTCSVWLPDVCLLNQQPQLDLILQLYDIGCIMFGNFVQASGQHFHYVDLRKIISNPKSSIKFSTPMQMFCPALTALQAFPMALPTATVTSQSPDDLSRKEVSSRYPEADRG